MAWYEWRPYLSVAERRARARRAMARRRKKGLPVEPVEVKGKSIANTFWGCAWCDHLEKFSDFANRLPRGRTYVRNGSVCHLEIGSGEIRAMVMGSELYEVRVTVKKLTKTRWRAVKTKCAGGIASLLELLEGRLSRGVMTVVSHRDHGIFPLPREIEFGCTCPDWATMCKHVAAVLYGVGARLDERPDLLFLLRGVDHEELISADPSAGTVVGNRGRGRRRIAQRDLAGVFDIDIVGSDRGTNAKVTEPAPVDSPRGAKRGTRGALDPSKEPRRANTADRSGPASARVPRFFTGASVARLRSKLAMTRGQLAVLLGVSDATIGTWEKTEGRLNLRDRNHEALVRAASMSKGAAWAQLDIEE